MMRTWAIARLTFFEGIRMKIVLVFLLVLVFIVLRLPFALKGDETLSGRLQTFLAYSLGSVSMLLGLATVFLSCSTLSNEIKNFSIHMVVTKPVARFQILLGKWLGVTLLNVMMLAMSGATIYGFARFIREQPVQFERDRINLRDVVWSARAVALPVVPQKEIADDARRDVDEKMRQGRVDRAGEDAALAEAVRERLGQWLRVPPGEVRTFRFENLTPPENDDAAIQVRFDVRGIPLPLDELVVAEWTFLDVDTEQMLAPPFRSNERSGNRHQFLVRGNRVIKNGKALLAIANPDPATSITFENEKSLEILYRVGSFEGNLVKALLLTFFALTFLSGVGLFFSVFVSFPVACLCTLAAYLIGMAWPFWFEAIGGNIKAQYWTPSMDPYGQFGPAVRLVMVPFLKLFPDFVKYDGAAPLVDGAYISADLLADCGLRTLVLAAVLLLLVGWFIFRRREIAQVTV
ncbi:ABC-2 family transporter protein [Phycisphaerae bacterium RAS1]|nr:ABC-2 family transporter protein [Phycisphaerae bacterium RAS1]